MLNQRESAAYQAAAANGATQAGLLHLVYTHLAKDLLQAADAVQRNSVADRCVASNHALLLLGHLESWVQDIQEVELAASLRTFYRMLRTSVLQLQAEATPGSFEQLSQLVLDTGAAWKAKEVTVPSTNRHPDKVFTGIHNISFQA